MHETQWEPPSFVFLKHLVPDQYRNGQNKRKINLDRLTYEINSLVLVSLLKHVKKLSINNFS